MRVPERESEFHSKEVPYCTHLSLNRLQGESRTPFPSRRPPQQLNPFERGAIGGHVGRNHRPSKALNLVKENPDVLALACVHIDRNRGIPGGCNCDAFIGNHNCAIRVRE